MLPILFFILVEFHPKAKEEEQKERQKILEKFTNGPFEDIVARSEAKVSTVHVRVHPYSWN